MITLVFLLIAIDAIVCVVASFSLGSVILMNIKSNIVVVKSLVSGAAHRQASCDVWSVFVEHAYANWCRCWSSSMGAVLFRLSTINMLERLLDLFWKPPAIQPRLNKSQGDQQRGSHTRSQHNISRTEVCVPLCGGTFGFAGTSGDIYLWLRGLFR